MHKKNKSAFHQKGYIISITTFFILIIITTLAMSMSSIIIVRNRSALNMVKSTQSYYAAESGIEDALLRLENNPQMGATSYNITVGDATASVVIPEGLFSRTITSNGTNGNITRSANAVLELEDANLYTFYYAVHVGQGGISMGSNAKILGNVFSGGNIIGFGLIGGNATISGNGNYIQSSTVQGDVLAYSCLSPAQVQGNLTYVLGGQKTCTVAGTTTVRSTPITDEPLPIPQSQIDDWKAKAATNTTNGNVTVSGSQSMGPRKIVGDLTISNGATLNVTGTIYVTGKITFNNNVTVRLDSSYGPAGGVIISDGHMVLSNNNIFNGSGHDKSYVMLLSTLFSSSISAITVNNNITGKPVLYAQNGTVFISNNASVTSATARRLDIRNNAKVQFSTGFENIYFAGGISDKMMLKRWQEK